MCGFFRQEKDKEVKDLLMKQRSEMESMKYQLTQESEVKNLYWINFWHIYSFDAWKLKSDSFSNFNSTIRDLKYEREMASDEIKSVKEQLEYQKSINDKLALKLKQTENLLAEKVIYFGFSLSILNNLLFFNLLEWWIQFFESQSWWKG